MIDILEDRLPKEILTELLKDHTTEKNIFWASSDYSELGQGFEVNDIIETHSVTGRYGKVIMSRILKTKAQKKKRTIEKAEIFTPAWVCNDMCNAGDESYRAKDSDFNKSDYVDGKHVWCACSEPIRFAEGVTWQDYILSYYLKTKFFRYLLLQALASMNISRGNFRFVPLQDFTVQSDIDWNKSISEIDQQLYDKYGLSEEEIAFIEGKIKEMK